MCNLITDEQETAARHNEGMNLTRGFVRPVSTEKSPILSPAGVYNKKNSQSIDL